MFTLYRKNVGGRIADRYFQKKENAKAALLEDLERLTASGWNVEHKRNHYDADKGTLVYDFQGTTPKGEKFSLSLHYIHFED